MKGLGSPEGERSSGSDPCGRSGSDAREVGVECPLFPPSIVGVLGSTGGNGSNSLIWSVNGDGAGLFDPIDNPDSSASALNLTGGSFDSSSVDSSVKL